MKRVFSSKLRLAALLAAMALTVSLAGCSLTGEESSSDIPSEPVTEPSQTTATTAAPTTYLNPLTGLSDMLTPSNRPIGFVVSDETASLVQIGLESADMYFESETEAGIPRILAIYSNVDRIPDAIGPVRSARPHFVKFAKALDCIYCHIGGSHTGLETIKELGVTHLTNCSEIDPILKASKNFSWNRSAFTKAKVQASTKNLSKTSATKSPYQFGEVTGGQPAASVSMRLSERYHMSFTYDAATKLYTKHRSSLDTPLHQTATGGMITASNVIIMYDRRTFDQLYKSKSGKTANRYDFDMNSGTGVLCSGGTCRPIYWARSNSQLSYYEEGGAKPLTVAPGKTYVCLASDTLRGDLECK